MRAARTAYAPLRSSIFDPSPPPIPRQRAPRDTHDAASAMAATPKRQCVVSTRLLPRAFLLPLSPARTPNNALVLPALQHPKFAPRRPGMRIYTALHPLAVQLLGTPKGRHISALRGVLGSDARSVMVPPRLGEMVGSQLGLRVAQELELDTAGLCGVDEEGVVGVIDLREESDGGEHHGLPVWNVQRLCAEHAAEVSRLVRAAVDAPLVGIRKGQGIPLSIALTRAALWKEDGWDVSWVHSRGRGNVSVGDEDISPI